MPETECDFHCGYVGPPDQDFRDHVIWEHAHRCTECPATTQGPDSLTHRLDCPRLQPGYTYPPPEALEDSNDQ